MRRVAQAPYRVVRVERLEDLPPLRFKIVDASGRGDLYVAEEKGSSAASSLAQQVADALNNAAVPVAAPAESTPAAPQPQPTGMVPALAHAIDLLSE